MIRLPIVLTFAWKEFLESIRNWWLTGTVVLFVLLSLGIVGYGTTQGGEGSTMFSITIASLVSLVIYLMPIMALLLGSAMISGEAEQGSLVLLLSQPITRLEIIFGKYLGLAASLTVSTFAGFTLTGILLLVKAGTEGLVDYLLFIVTSLGLGFIFLSISLLLSVLVKSKAGAAIGAVITWFCSVFIFDLVLIGLFIVASGKEGLGWVSGLIFLNPVDLFRLANVLHIEELRGSMGLVGMIPDTFANLAIILAAFLGWILIPLGAASTVFARREL